MLASYPDQAGHGSPSHAARPPLTPLQRQGESMYGKVFRSLWEGSLIARPDDQLVFIFLLAHSDPVGHVEVSRDFVVRFTLLRSNPVKRTTKSRLAMLRSAGISLCA